MILFIIFVCLLVIGLALLIITLVRHWFDEHEWIAIPVTAALVFGVCGTLATSCISITATCMEATVADNIQNSIDYLNNEYTVLWLATNDLPNYSLFSEQVQAIYNAASSYNLQVKTFKEDIETGKKNAQDPWINWESSKAYMRFSADAVKYFDLV